MTFEVNASSVPNRGADMWTAARVKWKCVRQAVSLIAAAEQSRPSRWFARKTKSLPVAEWANLLNEPSIGRGYPHGTVSSE